MAHPDLDELLHALLPMAQERLEAEGGFVPFGASMERSGEVNLAETRAIADAQSDDFVDALVAAFQQEAQAGVIRAAAICVDVSVIPPGKQEQTDAISVRLEHASGEAVEVFVPYRRPRSGAVQYGDIFGRRTERAVFGGDSSASEHP